MDIESLTGGQCRVTLYEDECRLLEGAMERLSADPAQTVAALGLQGAFQALLLAMRLAEFTGDACDGVRWDADAQDAKLIPRPT